jgi:hypothetical protein
MKDGIASWLSFPAHIRAPLTTSPNAGRACPALVAGSENFEGEREMLRVGGMPVNRTPPTRLTSLANLPAPGEVKNRGAPPPHFSTNKTNNSVSQSRTRTLYRGRGVAKANSTINILGIASYRPPHPEEAACIVNTLPRRSDLANTLPRASLGTPTRFPERSNGNFPFLGTLCRLGRINR